MKYIKIKYRLLVYLTSFTVCSGDIIKKSSENNQSTGHFYSFFFRPLDLKSEKKNVNELIKISGLF